MKTLLAIAFLALPLTSLAASGGDADVCYSTPSPDPANRLSSSTELVCPRAGTHTLPQLAQAGWGIVSVQSVVASMADPAHSLNSWMVVIQKKAN
ncbi:MAG: hypothetical protein RSP_05060 [Rhodanobacter sp.]